jgi:hypothetical protein
MFDTTNTTIERVRTSCFGSFHLTTDMRVRGFRCAFRNHDNFARLVLFQFSLEKAKGLVGEEMLD